VKQSERLGIFRLSADRCVLLVVDIQEAFLEHIGRIHGVIERSKVMIEAAKLLRLPVVVTEQYRRGLGPTVEPLREVLGDCVYYDKVSFSCWADEAVRKALQAVGRDQVLLVGIETHVCIVQTALEMLAAGWQAFVAVDATGSRRQSDCETSLERLGQAGAVLTTTEAAIMEMTVSSKHPAFREISKLIR